MCHSNLSWNGTREAPYESGHEAGSLTANAVPQDTEHMYRYIRVLHSDMMRSLSGSI